MPRICSGKTDGTIPNEFFRGEFKWFCCECIRSQFFFVQLTISIGAVLVFYITDIFQNWEWSTETSKIATISAGLYMSICDFIDCHMRRRCASKNLEIVADSAKAVFDSKCGIDTNYWVEIAKISNSAFFSKGIWKTPYFFYDGPGCKSMFRRAVLKHNSMNGTTKSFREIEGSEKNSVRNVVYRYEQALGNQFDISAAEAAKISDKFRKHLRKDRRIFRYSWKLSYALESELLKM